MNKKKFEVFFVMLALTVCKSNLFAQIKSDNFESNFEVLSSDRKELFDELVQLNFDSWNDQYIKELIIAEGIAADSEQKSIEIARSDDKKYTDTALNIFQNVIEKGRRDDLESAARLKTAAILTQLRKSNAAILKVLSPDFISEQFEVQNPAAGVRINLIRAHLLLKNGSLIKVEKALQRAVLLAGKIKNGSALRLQANLSLGDYFFESSLFSRAIDSFEKSLLAINENEYEFAKWRSAVRARIFWSHYRAGRYDLASAEFVKVSQSLSFQDTVLSDAVIDELIRLAAISFYELKNETTLKSCLGNNLSGDWCHRTVIGLLKMHRNAGDVARAIRIGSATRPFFDQSRHRISFEREAIESLGQRDKSYAYWQYVGQRVLDFQKNGRWSGLFVSDTKLFFQREEFVREFAEKSGDNFYLWADKSGKKSDFDFSHKIFDALLQENISPESYGLLLQKSGDSALLSDNLSVALDRVEKSFKYVLTSDQERTGLFLQVEILRRFIFEEMSAKSEISRKYILAVDNFFLRFPRDSSARLAALECATKFEKWNQPAEFRERLHALYLNVGLDATASQVEREKIIHLLIKAELKLQDSNFMQTSRALSNLQQDVDSGNFSLLIKSEVAAANVAAIRTLALEFRKKGKLSEARDEVTLWVKRHKQHDQSALVLLDAMRVDAELMLFEDLLKIYPLMSELKNGVAYAAEAKYWQARAFEAQLKFNSAAQKYKEVAESKSESLRQKDRLDALKRLEFMLTEFADHRALADAYALHAKVLQEANEISALPALHNLAAENYLKSDRIVEARQQWNKLKIYSNKNIRFRYAALAGEIRCNLASDQISTMTNAAIEADKLWRGYFLNAGKISVESKKLGTNLDNEYLLKQSLALANEADLKLIPTENRISFNERVGELGRSTAILNRMLGRAKLIGTGDNYANQAAMMQWSLGNLYVRLRDIQLAIMADRNGNSDKEIDVSKVKIEEYSRLAQVNLFKSYSFINSAGEIEKDSGLPPLSEILEVMRKDGKVELGNVSSAPPVMGPMGIDSGGPQRDKIKNELLVTGDVRASKK